MNTSARRDERPACEPRGDEPVGDRLAGGDPRSLGRTDEVIALVLANTTRVDELFECLFDEDPVVRMRAGDALEKIARQRPGLLEPYTERLLGEVAAIEQASVQWHLAQLLSQLPLKAKQRVRAIELLKRNLERSHDWIVINLTLEALADFAAHDAELHEWLVGRLPRYLASDRKSIARRAHKLSERLAGGPGS